MRLVRPLLAALIAATMLAGCDSARPVGPRQQWQEQRAKLQSGTFYGKEKKSLAYVIGHSRLIMGALGRLSPNGVLSRIGRNSLPVFWLGTALSVVGQVLLFAAQPGPVGQIAFLAAGILAQAALAYFLDYLGKASSRAKADKKAAAEVPGEAAGKDATATA